MELPSQKIECDVLVVGGSTAALTAALEARKSVENVVVVCKRKAGRSGNTIVAGTGFSVSVLDGSSDDSPDLHLRDTLAGGADVNDPELARLLVFEGPDAVVGLEEYGVRFRRDGGLLMRRSAGGHSRPRILSTDPGNFTHKTRGLGINLPLAESARARGVRLLSDLTVHRLLMRDGITSGALAIDWKTGSEVTLIAPTIVLAAGGGGRLFANTNNTAEMTGDSYALALEAGVTLRDMEFVQFYPTMMSSPVHSTLSSSIFGEGAVLRNLHGDRFMPRYDPANADMATRDVMSRAIFNEIREGNGVPGGVYVDMSAIPTSALEKKVPTLLKLLLAHGLDPAKQYAAVSPATHFLMGGAWIDGSCRTNVEGLFAAGEAAGGIHGANRLGGNALSETATFGKRAGAGAAAHTRALQRRPEPPGSRPDIPRIRSGSLSLAEVRAELRRAMWENSGIVRNGAGLRRAQASLRECLQALPKCAVTGPADIATHLEIERMAIVGLAITACAMERTESRGAHYRSDHPNRDDVHWRGSIKLDKVGDELRTTFVPL